MKLLGWSIGGWLRNSVKLMASPHLLTIHTDLGDSQYPLIGVVGCYGRADRAPVT